MLLSGDRLVTLSDERTAYSHYNLMVMTLQLIYVTLQLQMLILKTEGERTAVQVQ